MVRPSPIDYEQDCVAETLDLVSVVSANAQCRRCRSGMWATGDRAVILAPQESDMPLDFSARCRPDVSRFRWFHMPAPTMSVRFRC